MSVFGGEKASDAERVCALLRQSSPGSTVPPPSADKAMDSAGPEVPYHG
jgi:hypothetical protein